MIEGVVVGHSWHCPSCDNGDAADHEFFAGSKRPSTCAWCGNKKITKVRRHLRLEDTAEFRERLAQELSVWMLRRKKKATPTALRHELDAVLGPVADGGTNG